MSRRHIAGLLIAPLLLFSLPALAEGYFGTPVQLSVGVTTFSSVILTNIPPPAPPAAQTRESASNFIKLCVPLSAAVGIWVRWDGATATQAPPAEFLAPGQCAVWTRGSGYLPTSPITAISSATVAVTLIHD